MFLMDLQAYTQDRFIYCEWCLSRIYLKKIYFMLVDDVLDYK